MCPFGAQAGELAGWIRASPVHATARGAAGFLTRTSDESFTGTSVKCTCIRPLLFSLLQNTAATLNIAYPNPVRLSYQRKLFAL